MFDLETVGLRGTPERIDRCGTFTEEPRIHGEVTLESSVEQPPSKASMFVAWALFTAVCGPIVFVYVFGILYLIAPWICMISAIYFSNRVPEERMWMLAILFLFGFLWLLVQLA